IPQATNQEIVPDRSGVYTIEVAVGACTTTASYEFSVTGLEESFSRTINVYPNPATDRFSIELKEQDPAEAVILNNVGKSIGSVAFSIMGDRQIGEFNLEHQAAGFYLIKVRQNKKIIHYKIIKK